MVEIALDCWMRVPLAVAAATTAETWLNTRSFWLLGVVLAILAGAYIVGMFLRKQPEGTVHPALARAFNERVRAWWTMAAILMAGFLLGYHATVFLFFLVSFWALREFITMTPTRRSDHRTLFWVFFVITPAHYVLVGLGEEWYKVYSIMIPVFGWLFLPSRIAFSGDAKRFLERSAKILAGLIICVYSLSYAPALLDLTFYTRGEAETLVKWDGSKPGLLFYFVLLVQLADLLQYAWGKLIGRHVIAPNINASRTWEGFCGGVASTTVFGVLLAWVTPFSVWGSACMAMIVAIMGFAGGMTMSAIKRDRGVKDYGTLVQGHAGVLDRIDSICFAAPVFFHIAPLISRLS
ncbi:MAG: phosphatidate cytidylyltransferase [Pirellulaceae bacterium]